MQTYLHWEANSNNWHPTNWLRFFPPFSHYTVTPSLSLTSIVAMIVFAFLSATLCWKKTSGTFLWEENERQKESMIYLSFEWGHTHLFLSHVLLWPAGMFALPTLYLLHVHTRKHEFLLENNDKNKTKKEFTSNYLVGSSIMAMPGHYGE